MSNFVEFKADKRIFLLFSALNSCGYDWENNKKGMHSVRVKVRKELKDRELTTIAALRGYFDSLPCEIGIQGGQVKFVSWILHFSDPPDLQRTQKGWFGDISESKFTSLEDLLRKFYLEAGVEELWKQCLPAYQEEIERYEESTKKEVSFMLEYLKLNELPSERIIHIPNLLDSYWVGYGPKVGDNSYVIFGPTAGRTFLGLHEHLHPIVKPMLKENVAIVKDMEHLYSDIKSRMQHYGYSTWDITVEECLIRALAIKMMKAMLPKLSTENSIQREHDRGFIFVKTFYDQLAAYEESNMSFKEYLPTILEALKSQ